MVFAHHNQPVARRIQCGVGIAQDTTGQVGRQWLRRAAIRHAIQALVGEVGEVGGPTSHQKRAAAIFVDAGTNIEWSGRHIGDLAIRGATHQHAASAISGA